MQTNGSQSLDQLVLNSAVGEVELGSNFRYAFVLFAAHTVYLTAGPGQPLDGLLQPLLSLPVREGLFRRRRSFYSCLPDIFRQALLFYLPLEEVDGLIGDDTNDIGPGIFYFRQPLPVGPDLSKDFL